MAFLYIHPSLREQFAAAQIADEKQECMRHCNCEKCRMRRTKTLVGFRKMSVALGLPKMAGE